MSRILPQIIESSSVETTIAAGIDLGKILDRGSIVCFYGDLGAGKTTFIKGVVQGVTGIAHKEVNSPTFIYLNIYGDEKPLYHFDLYRLRGMEEFFDKGFDEYLFGSGICCIEWSERIESALPKNCIPIHLTHLSTHCRRIEIKACA